MADNTKQTDFRFSEQFEPDVFWENHGRKVVGGLLVLIAIGAVIFLWQQRTTQAALEASQRLAAARDVVALEAVIRDYPGQPVAAQARLRLADVHYREGRFTDAAQQYQTFLELNPAHPLAPSAQLGLAAVAEAQGDWAGARGQYERLTGFSAGNYAVALAKFGLARCAEAKGQPKEAQQMYEELMALTQGTRLQETAYLRWAMLGRQSPAGDSGGDTPPAQP